MKFNISFFKIHIIAYFETLAYTAFFGALSYFAALYLADSLSAICWGEMSYLTALPTDNIFVSHLLFILCLMASAVVLYPIIFQIKTYKWISLAIFTCLFVLSIIIIAIVISLLWWGGIASLLPYAIFLAAVTYLNLKSLAVYIAGGVLIALVAMTMSWGSFFEDPFFLLFCYAGAFGGWVYHSVERYHTNRLGGSS